MALGSPFSLAGSLLVLAFLSPASSLPSVTSEDLGQPSTSLPRAAAFLCHAVLVALGGPCRVLPISGYTWSAPGGKSRCDQSGRHLQERERERGLLSFGGVTHTSTPPPTLLSSLQVWLPAMKAKGLEISGTFTRQVGSISMDLQLTNKALQVMTDFAIQFNRNR